MSNIDDIREVTLLAQERISNSDASENSCTTEEQTEMVKADPNLINLCFSSIEEAIHNAANAGHDNVYVRYIESGAEQGIWVGINNDWLALFDNRETAGNSIIIDNVNVIFSQYDMLGTDWQKVLILFSIFKESVFPAYEEEGYAINDVTDYDDDDYYLPGSIGVWEISW